jgi:hypothetical protein
MSDHNDPWETEMSRTFDRRVRDLHEAPLSFDQVRGRAGRIRRNRRIAVAGGIVAAAAVIVPVAAIGGSDLFDRDSSRPPVADTDRNKTEHADDTSGSFGYIEDRTMHLPDGTTITTEERYRGGVVLGDTVFAIRNDDETGQLYLDVVGEDAPLPVESTEVISGPVLNDDHTAVAYIESNGDLVTATESGEATTLASGLGENSQLTALTGDCSAGECRAYVDDDVLGEPRVYDQDGRNEVAVPGVIGVQDATADGLLAVQQSYSNEGSCSGVYDVTTSGDLWDTCDYYLLSLSPDGRYVEATHPYLDALGNAWTAILDSETGKELARFDRPQGIVTTSVWQDTDRLLVNHLDLRTNAWSVYRIGADGSSERVLGPQPGPDPETSPYTLLEGS